MENAYMTKPVLYFATITLSLGVVAATLTVASLAYLHSVYDRNQWLSSNLDRYR